MLFIKFVLTLFVFILVPVYFSVYGPQNFLWLSDIGLFGTVLALWLESRLLMSTIVLAILPIELLWNIDFFVRLLTSYSVFGIVEYMFDPQYPFFVRCLSLFHIFVPCFWGWYLSRYGYDKRALPYAIILNSVTLLVTYMVTNPQYNINWVFSAHAHNWQWISGQGWLIILMILFALLYWLLHQFFLVLTNQKSVL